MYQTFIESGLLQLTTDQKKAKPGSLRNFKEKDKELSQKARDALTNSAYLTLLRGKIKRMRPLYSNPRFRASTGLVEERAEEQMDSFIRYMEDNIKNWSLPVHQWKNVRLHDTLRQLYIEKGDGPLMIQLKFILQGHVANETFSKDDILNQARLADFRYPYEWYPEARSIQRKIHLHIGPTNSGKTYHALERLKQAADGVYAGPLRLLAHEVYSRMNTAGRPCHLITGDEMILSDDPDATLASCTVEMMPLHRDFEVAVVDEIQMIGDRDRGFAWSQAVLGLRAKELHLCGEARALPIIRALAAAMGDELIIHQYKRLSPLKTMSTSLKGDLKQLRKGDCVVAFSRAMLHELKKEIVKVTGKKVAVVYGSLPPETRAQQAKLFNDPDNDYDILVASNAIGMGLNLYNTLFHN